MLEKYENKKICVLGFGLEGRATFEYLRRNGIKPAIADKLEKHEFAESNPLLQMENVDLILGPDYLDRLKDFDFVFKTPGISPLLPEIIEAENNGTVIASQVELFFDLCPCQINGVTGTKGKGTTSTLIYEILRRSGEDAYLGGNIGVPGISFLDKLKSNSIVILELSSFQLQVLKKSPHIAVVLMITSEHLDYHKDVEEYRDAKKNIVRFQNQDDFIVANHDYDATANLVQGGKAEIFYVSRYNETNGCFVDDNDQVLLKSENGVEKIINANDLELRGRHNLENVTAAVMAGYLAGASLDAIKSVVKDFKGLEHRLEFVREIGGVKYYNDSISTVPETAIAAIDAFTQPKIMILGGSFKGSDYTELGRKIDESNVKAVILIGKMAEEISSKIPEKYSGQRVMGLEKMPDIVKKAAEIASEGDVVLLSPSCASFGSFLNYKDRGNQFKKAVNSL